MIIYDHILRGCEAMFVNELVNDMIYNCLILFVDCLYKQIMGIMDMRQNWRSMILIWSARSPILSCNLKRYRFVTKSIHKVGEWVYFPSRAPCNEVTSLWRPDPTLTWRHQFWHHTGTLWIFMDLHATLLPRPRCCYDLAPVGWLHSISGALSNVNWCSRRGRRFPNQARGVPMTWSWMHERPGSQCGMIRDSVLTSCPSHIWFQGGR